MKKITLWSLIVSLLVILSSCNVDGNNEVNNLSSIEEVSRGISGIPNSQINNELKNYLGLWKSEYYKTKWIDGKKFGYIWMEGQGNAGEMVSTSEAMGYGFRLLGYRHSFFGKDDYYIDIHRSLRKTVERFHKEKTHSDGLKYVSTNWYVPKDWDPKTVEGDRDAGPATDGDLDIAYGLILGSELLQKYHDEYKSGRDKIPYAIEYHDSRNYALKIIRGIAINYYGEKTVNGKTRNYLQIAPSTWSQARVLTRPSDWMPHHLETFIKYYNDYGDSKNKSFYINRLQDLLDGTLEMIKDQKWGGIFPDFIKFENGSYRPFTKYGNDKALYVDLGEKVTPNHYSWNACRVPWRFSEYLKMSYDTYSSNYDMVDRATSTLGSGLMDSGYASSVGSEYNLNFGKEVNSYDTAFAAPAAAALSCFRPTSSGAGNFKTTRMKANYNLLINKFKGHHDDKERDGYYADSINAFSLLLMTDKMVRAYK